MKYVIGSLLVVLILVLIALANEYHKDPDPMIIGVACFGIFAFAVGLLTVLEDAWRD